MQLKRRISWFFIEQNLTANQLQLSRNSNTQCASKPRFSSRTSPNHLLSLLISLLSPTDFRQGNHTFQLALNMTVYAFSLMLLLIALPFISNSVLVWIINYKIILFLGNTVWGFFPLISILFFIGICLGSYRGWNGGYTPFPLLFLVRKVQRRKNRIERVRFSLSHCGLFPASWFSKQWCTYDIHLIKVEKAQTIGQILKRCIQQGKIKPTENKVN